MNKDIDNIFKDGLQGHTEEPPAFIWDSINSELGAARSNNRRIVLWRSLAAAAFVGVIFLSGLLFKGIDDNLNESEVIGYDNRFKDDVEKKELVEKITETSSKEEKEDLTKTRETIIEPEELIVQVSKESINTKKGIADKKAEQKPQIVEKPSESEAQFYTDNTKAEEPTIAAFGDTVIGDEAEESEPLPVVSSAGAQSMLAQGNQKKEYEPFPGKPSVYNPTKSKSKYVVTLGGQVAPSYSDKEVSGVSNSANKESGIVTLSGGINVNVKSKSRWSIETGAYYTQSGQKFSNEIYSDGMSLYMRASRAKDTESSVELPLTNSLGSINLKNIPVFGEDNGDVMPSLPSLSNPEEVLPSTSLGMLDIQQELDFIEVPLLVRYHLIDSKVNLSLAGGMSTNFLVDNNVYYLDGGNKTWIGETEQINKVNYSAVVGLGLQAPIWKTLHFNFEPRIKYFMNSVSSDNSVNYKPYSIGLFTGVSYRF